MTDSQRIALLEDIENLLRKGERHQAVKLLRSIEIAALREARGIVERYTRPVALEKLDIKIREIELK